MTLTTWGALSAICLFGAMSPGPSLAVVLRQTISNGRTHGIFTACAHACGVAIWAILTIWGLALLVTQTPLLYQLLTYAGAAYLGWLGVKALCSKSNSHLEVTQNKTSLGKAARDGVLVSLLNPKLAIFFIALFSQYVSTDLSLTDQVVMIGTVASIDSLWFILIAVLLSQSRLLETVRQKASTIDKACGIVLIALALRVVTL